MVEKFGTLAEFDFLYQKTGGSDGKPPSVGGVPRGYAFVTYKTVQSARSAQRTLDGLDISGRKLAVKWAYLQDQVNLPPKKGNLQLSDSLLTNLFITILLVLSVMVFFYIIFLYGCSLILFVRIYYLWLIFASLSFHRLKK